jgi:ABC-type phosphate/phosphonate transport system substrate-binding protein
MRNFQKLLLVAGLAIAMLPMATPTAEASINIGVMAPRGPLKAMKRWIEFGRYMSKQLGERVKITPLSPPNMVPVARAGSVDFTLANPTMAVILQEVYKAEPLATLTKKTGSQFAGVIVAKKGSGITKAADLKGKKVMALKFRRAAGAYTFQTYHLKQQGIDPHKDFASFTEGKRQDELILAVDRGDIDAAFVRSGMLESMAKEGKIKLEDFVAVDQRDGDGLPQLHTTTLYPEWYLSAMKGTDKALAKRVKAACLSLGAKEKAARRAKIVGFVEPVPMDSMKAALKSLKITPYDK